ncbi:hypothetical protein BJX70DRAFT_387454 [Aspergillus crustosus]
MDDLPSCALTCLIGAIKNSTCALTDFACICSDTQLNAQLELCIAGSCKIREALTAQNFSYTTCAYPADENTLVFPVVNIVGIVVAVLAVVLRVMNRVVGGQLGLDDYTIVASLLVAVAIAGVGIPLKTYGLGKNIWTVPFNDISETMKLFFVEENLYCLCVGVIKCSMLLLYLRLFPNKALRLTIYMTLGVTIAWTTASLFSQLFSCSPISHYWTRWDGEHEGRCTSHNALLLAHAVINIVLDVAVMAIPMPVLIKLQMSLEKRIGMCMMFAVGIVVTVISILRLVEAVGFNTTMNPTKDFVPVGIWSLLEIDVGIMCSCMPGIRALCKRLWGRFVKKPTGYRHNTSNPKASSGASRDKYSPQQFSSKSSHGDSSSGGQFIRLDEIEAADGRWPLRDTELLVRQESERLGRPRASQGWHSRYPSSPSPTRLRPPPLLPPLPSPRGRGMRASGSPRAPSAHFTWFKEGDLS